MQLPSNKEFINTLSLCSAWCGTISMLYYHTHCLARSSRKGTLFSGRNFKSPAQVTCFRGIKLLLVTCCVFSLSSPLHSCRISLFFCAVPVYCDSGDFYYRNQDTKDNRVSPTLYSDVAIKKLPIPVKTSYLPGGSR